jgi:hypothetical protein
MKKIWLAIVYFGICIINPLLALSSPVLDQFQTNMSGGYSYFDWVSVAQTFTAGLSGKLDHIEVGMVSGYMHFPTYPTYVEIWNTNSSGAPGNVIGSVFIENGFSWFWNTIDFAANDIYLEAGTQYSIVLQNHDKVLSGSTNGVAITLGSNSYTGGTFWHRYFSGAWQIDSFNGSETDMQFKTYMDTAMVPEPTTLLLLSPGLGVIGLAAWRNRRFIHPY